MHTDEAGYTADMIQRLIWLTFAGRHPGELPPAQWAALRFFHRANKFSCTLKAFTEYHATTCGSASQTVNSLVAKGFLARMVSSRDRRSVHFELTEKGRRMLEQDPLDNVAVLVDTLPEDKRSELAAIMLSLMNHIGHARGKPNFGTCSTCAFFKETFDHDWNGPSYFCSRAGEKIADLEQHELCMNHSPRMPEPISG